MISAEQKKIVKMPMNNKTMSAFIAKSRDFIATFQMPSRAASCGVTFYRAHMC